MKKLLIIIVILLFTAVSAYALRLPLWYSTVGSSSVDLSGTYWTTARTSYWTDARTSLWTTPRNAEVH